MNPKHTITDDDLVLLYYGEHDDPQLAARVAADPDLTARFDRLGAELDAADAWVPPERGEDYGAEVWRRVSPHLEPRSAPELETTGWWVGLLRPRFSLAGALGLALVAVVAFQLGRQESPVVTPNDPADVILDMAGLGTGLEDGLDTERLLSHSVGRHLEQLDQALTNFVNLDESAPHEAAAATDMLVANRLYRQVALARGDRQLATFLAELEPLLIELAYEAHKSSPETRQRMQAEVRDGLLFRVRAVNRQLASTPTSI